MSKISKAPDVSNVTDPKEFMRFVSNIISDIVNVINGKLEFDQNIISQTVDVTFDAINTDQAISHNLNRNNLKYIVCKKDQVCSVFNGTTSNSNNTIYLQCDQTAKVSLILF